MLETDLISSTIPPEISFPFSTVTTAATSYQAPFPATNYVPSYPYYGGPTVSSGYNMVIAPPLTEEQIRQILREELARYFDEAKDILAPSAKIITVCAFCQREVPVRFEIQDADRIGAGWHRCCDPCLETMQPSHVFVRPLS
jgi:hypothetical protein